MSPRETTRAISRKVRWKWGTTSKGKREQGDTELLDGYGRLMRRIPLARAALAEREDDEFLFVTNVNG